MQGLSHNKNLDGELTVKTEDGFTVVQSIPRDDASMNGIRNYRWVDGQHDFEPKFPKNDINNHLRAQYGIGSDEFRKDGLETTAKTLTTSNRNTLHEVLDFEFLYPYDSNLPITVTFPNSETNTPQNFQHDAPTIVKDVMLDNIENERIDTQVGDILVTIFGHKDMFMQKADAVKNFLGIPDSINTYSKDAANISTETFQAIFNDGIDYSYFSEILDPASEQTDMLPANVKLTLLFCYIKGEPVYISLKKVHGDAKPKQTRTWYYAFHKNKDEVVPHASYEVTDFGVTKSGGHLAPDIDTASIYIKDHIYNKKMSAILAKVTNAVSRQKNKAKKIIMGKNKLTKEESKNLKRKPSYTVFYNGLIERFANDTELNLSPEDRKTIVISFKTIGDQMYLYDSVLLSKLKNDEGNIDQSWVITIDTFLKDYIIYTKSANVISTVKYGKTPGMRKMAVYLKPRKELTEEEKLIRAEEKRRKEEAERIEYETKTAANKTRFGGLIIEETQSTPISMDNFRNIIATAQPLVDSRRNDVFILNEPVENTNTKGIYLILLYYAILTYSLARVESNILLKLITAEKEKLNSTFEQLTAKQLTAKQFTVEKQNMHIESISNNIANYNLMKSILEIQSPNWIEFTKTILHNYVLSPEITSKNSDLLTSLTSPITDFLTTEKKTNMLIVNDIVNNLTQVFKRGPIQYIKEYSFFMSEMNTINNNLNQFLSSQSGGTTSTNNQDNSVYDTLNEETNYLVSKYAERLETTPDDLDTRFINTVEHILNEYDPEEEIYKDDTERLSGEDETQFIPEDVFDNLYHLSILYNNLLETQKSDEIHLIDVAPTDEVPMELEVSDDPTGEQTGLPIAPLPSAVPIAVQPPAALQQTPAIQPLKPKKRGRYESISNNIHEIPNNIISDMPMPKAIRVAGGKKQKTLKKRQTKKKNTKKTTKKQNRKTKKNIKKKKQTRKNKKK